MIIVELIENGERERRYSDQGVKLLQVETGNIYEDAVDVIPCEYTYEETDIQLEEPITPSETYVDPDAYSSEYDISE